MQVIVSESEDDFDRWLAKHASSLDESPGGSVTKPGPGPEPKEPVPERKESALGWMREFVGVFDDLPEDFAAEHDHYIHGTPKRKKGGSRFSRRPTSTLLS